MYMDVYSIEFSLAEHMQQPFVAQVPFIWKPRWLFEIMAPHAQCTHLHIMLSADINRQPFVGQIPATEIPPPTAPVAPPAPVSHPTTIVKLAIDRHRRGKGI